MRPEDAYTVGLGKISNATFNADSSNGFATLNATINAQTIEGDSNFSTPLCYPFGVMGIPPDGTNCVTMNIQGGTMSPIVISMVPAYSSMYSISGMQKGEGITYSLNYSLQARLDGLRGLLDNTHGQNIATMLYGENIVKVLIDILEYLQTITGWIGDFQSTYNIHTHDDSSPPDPLFNDPVAYPTELIQDENDLANGKGYVNDDGEPM